MYCDICERELVKPEVAIGVDEGLFFYCTGCADTPGIFLGNKGLSWSPRELETLLQEKFARRQAVQ